MLEQHVCTLEANENNVPSKKARSESTSPTPPICRQTLPLDKLNEAKIEGIEAVSSCVEPQIDSQLIFLDHHIEQIQSTSNQLRQLYSSNDHMTCLYHKLSQTFHIQDEDKLFKSLREVKSSKVINLHSNLNEGFQVQTEFISKF